MDTLDRLSALLPQAVSEKLAAMAGGLTEVRLRAGRPVQLVSGTEDCFVGERMTGEALRRVLAALMDYSVYAREDELTQGFFTMRDGCRVGVCGRLAVADGRPVMTAVGSVCVRVAREIAGCADAVARHITKDGLRSTLVIAPPGMGKTTLLRDAARQLSEAGYNVAIADERHELAACVDGMPTADVGPRTDVWDGGGKAAAIASLIRGMSPQVIVADEIGGEGDARALAEARRCGVCVLASAHAGSIAELKRRGSLKAVLDGGVFDCVTRLESPPGTVAEIVDLPFEREG